MHHGCNGVSIRNNIMKPAHLNVPHSVLLALSLIGSGALAQTQELATAQSAPLLSIQANNWKKDLQRQGILHYSSSSRYRVAVPLASFGDQGPKLLFTYAPRLPGGEQRKVFLFYLQMEID
ncbi:MAG: hypothetical protein JWQ23_2333 [Herminiimonas sp.]|nr:hypothetical protein [Herminiimonas sp.]